MQMVLRPVCCRFWWHAVNLYLLLNFSHCSMTVLLSSRMDTPELLLTLAHKHWRKLTHTCTHPLSDTNTHRAISNQSQWLLCSSLNGRPDLRYAELFPPSPNFQAARGKRVWEKWRDREHEILLFLCNPLIHFILLPNLQGPGTTYSVMRKWVEEGSEDCWENSLQHPLQLSGETVKMQSFWVITIPSCDYSLNCHCTVGGRLGFIFVVWGNITIGNILFTSITAKIVDIKQTHL